MRNRRVVAASMVFASKSMLQSSHAISLSWQYTLLLPPWLRPSSSPAVIMGTPWAKSMVVIRLRVVRARSANVLGLFVMPSTPWFQLRLLPVPSRFSSWLSMLCLWL